MPKETCDICVENINKVNKKVSCPYCASCSCIKCCKRYIVDKISNASCMFCNKEWNDDFLDETFPKTFLNKEYKNHIQNIEFIKQEALMPQTMIKIEEDKKRINILKKINDLKKQIRDLEFEYSQVGIGNIEIVEDEKISIIKECPNEKCNGYLNNNYVCGICDLILCIKCEQIKEVGHNCKEEDIKTVIMKKKECKYCPNCSRQTFKDGGCYQIWCPPPCNGGKGTAWDFKTGKVDKGSVHAPLYYQYIRENNVITYEENQCGNNNILPTINQITRYLKLRSLIFYNNREQNLLFDIHRNINHILYIMGNYQTHNENFETHLNIRKKFLNNVISKEAFKNALSKNLKLKKKKQNIYENLEMVSEIGIDIFLRLFERIKIHKPSCFLNLKDFFIEFDKIRNYYNESITKTKKRFGIKGLDVSYMDENWRMIHKK